MRRTITTLAVAVAALAAACTPAPAPSGPPPNPPPGPAVVGTDTGPVRGTVTDRARTFQGIPYAAPPTGDLRWAAPQPARPWRQVRDATRPAAVCAQNGLELGRPSNAEDCLSLNVTTPRTTGGRLPVLLWVHGGSFKDGTGSSYGATRLADEGRLVVVTVNYRLGALGFLAHPALGQDAGNAGLLDQQAALRWVRRNIGAFGGDAGNVTLAGESAGGTSVCAHLAAPGSRGLFRRAIMQSNNCSAAFSPQDTSGPRPRAVAERLARIVARKLGCTDERTAAACLRAVPVPRLRAASGDGEGAGPEFDTPALPEDPARALTDGRTEPVAVLHGVNSDEETFRTYGIELLAGPTTLRGYVRELRRTFGADADAVLAEYGCTTDACAASTLSAVRTDVGYAQSAMRNARLFAARAPVYTYEFADRDAPMHDGIPPARFPLGAYHTAELVYLFDVPWARLRDAGQRALAATMIGYWSRFAHTGDPNGGGAPRWSPGGGSAPVVQSLVPGRIGPSPDFATRHHLAFWSSLGR